MKFSTAWGEGEREGRGGGREPRGGGGGRKTEGKGAAAMVEAIHVQASLVARPGNEATCKQAQVGRPPHMTEAAGSNRATCSYAS